MQRFFSEVNTEDQHKALQNDLRCLEEWSWRWQIDFNAAKCKVLHPGSKRFGRIYFTNEDKLLEAVREEKDLGVFMDDELNFQHTVDNMSKRPIGSSH